MYVSVLFIRALLSECRTRGIPREALLGGLDVDLQDSQATVPLDQYYQLLQKALDLTEDPLLGLRLAQNAPANMLQLVGHLLMSVRTIRDAIGVTRRYGQLFCDHVEYGFSHDTERAYFTCSVHGGRADLARVEIEYTLLTALRVGAHFVGPNREGVEIHVRYPDPKFGPAYAQHFGHPVRFQQAINAVVFPTHLLDAPQLHSDETTHRLLREGVERLLSERDLGHSLAERVRARLRFEHDPAQPDVARLARRLGLTENKLRRQLASEGTTLTTLINETRLVLACEALRRPDATIKEVSDKLGFSEPSAFHRAFKRWTGQTPSQYCRQPGAAQRYAETPVNAPRD